MRIPSDAVIEQAKLTDYLLRFRSKNDKSKYLRSAGFDNIDAPTLEREIRAASARTDAVLDRTSVFGSFYRVHGYLLGPNGVRLNILLIWHHRSDGRYYFVTLYPDKEPQ